MISALSGHWDALMLVAIDWASIGRCPTVENDASPLVTGRRRAHSVGGVGLRGNGFPNGYCILFGFGLFVLLHHQGEAIGCLSGLKIKHIIKVYSMYIC